MNQPATNPPHPDWFKPQVGYGYNEQTGQYELNAAERREANRGFGWFYTQMKRFKKKGGE